MIQFLNEHRVLIAGIIGVMIAFSDLLFQHVLLRIFRRRLIEVPFDESERCELDRALDYLSTSRGAPVGVADFSQEALTLYNALVERCGEGARIVVERDDGLEDITDKLFPKGLRKLEAGP